MRAAMKTWFWRIRNSVGQAETPFTVNPSLQTMCWYEGAGWSVERVEDLEVQYVLTGLEEEELAVVLRTNRDLQAEAAQDGL